MMGNDNKSQAVVHDESTSKVGKPGIRRYNRLGGRPGLYVDHKAVCDAVQAAWSGSGETITDVAAQFGVSRGWIHKWVYPALGCERHKE
jgi:hypothetical protein|tara:strand:+ start:278 stop:544 length:267 start_codon:yes stop_codon:yes gene_type:complete